MWRYTTGAANLVLSETQNEPHILGWSHHIMLLCVFWLIYSLIMMLGVNTVLFLFFFFHVSSLSCLKGPVCYILKAVCIHNSQSFSGHFESRNSRLHRKQSEFFSIPLDLIVIITKHLAFISKIFLKKCVFGRQWQWWWLRWICSIANCFQVFL